MIVDGCSCEGVVEAEDDEDEEEDELDEPLVRRLRSSSLRPVVGWRMPQTQALTDFQMFLAKTSILIAFLSISFSFMILFKTKKK